MHASRRGDLVVCVLSALAAAGCGGQKGPQVHIAIAHGAAAGRCVAGDTDDNISSAGITHVRLSVRTHATGDPVGIFACDRVFPVGQEPPFLDIPTQGQAAVDLYAEGFIMAPTGDPNTARVGPFRRVASGSLLNVPINSSTVPALRMYPSEAFRCAEARLTQARAFHTATLLPNGQVLIVGGLVASNKDQAKENLDGDQLFVTGTAELYDPITRSFRPVSGQAPTPRAFHHAVLLGDTQPYMIALVGGVTVGDNAGDQPQYAVNTGLEGSRLVPYGPQPLPVKAAPSELLVLDPVQGSASKMPFDGIPAAVFQAATPVPGGVAVAGGIAYGAMNATDLSPANMLVVKTNNVHGSNLVSAREGATLTPLYADNALVWGGALKATEAPGEVASRLSGVLPQSAAVMVAGAPLTWFHTATNFASTATSGQVLLTGGFQLQAGTQALQPPTGTSSLRVVTVSGALVSSTPVQLNGWAPPDDTTCQGQNRYRPAGWEATAALANRSGVLVTGGAPKTSPCSDCDAGSSLLCAIKQASLFEPADQLLRANELQVGRMGHTMTVLTDDSVLVVGGIGQADGTDRVIGEAELFDAKTVVPPYDLANPGAGDRDDPLQGELKTLGLQRAPGMTAIDPATNLANHECPTF